MFAPRAYPHGCARVDALRPRRRPGGRTRRGRERAGAGGARSSPPPHSTREFLPAASVCLAAGSRRLPRPTRLAAAPVRIPLNVAGCQPRSRLPPGKGLALNLAFELRVSIFHRPRSRPPPGASRPPPVSKPRRRRACRGRLFAPAHHQPPCLKTGPAVSRISPVALSQNPGGAPRPPAAGGESLSLAAGQVLSIDLERRHPRVPLRRRQREHRPFTSRTHTIC